MKTLITTLLTVGLMLPATTYAFSIDALIEAAKKGNGTYVESHSSVSTGGQTAKSGETVTTGEAHASSQVEINAHDNGGEVNVTIETSKNGESETKKYSVPIESNGVSVEADVSVTDANSNTEVKVNDELISSESNISAATTAVAFAVIAAESKFSLLFTSHIPNFFKKVFSFWWEF